MSVINYSMQEIDDLCEGVKSFFNRNSDKRLYAKYTKAYQHHSVFNKKDETEYFNELVDRCFWYLYVSNNIAYALQYREKLDLFSEESNPKHKHFSNKDLLKKLRSLEYNINTNDGHKFIEPTFWDFYEWIKKNIEDHFVEATQMVSLGSGAKREIIDTVLYPEPVSDFNND